MARNFFQSFLKLDHDAWFIVENKLTNHERIIQIDHENYYNFWTRSLLSLNRKFVNRISSSFKKKILTEFINWAAHPSKKILFELGIEDFNYPGTKRLFSEIIKYPDIVHLHLPKSGFFDLRYLPVLSHKFPVFFTLHGAWLLSGHCVHSFDCRKWMTGCGNCPDLTIPSPVKRDNTALNWIRKKRIYSRSKLYVGTPCNWLAAKVRQSMLYPACQELKVIPHGVDQNVFYPKDKRLSKEALGLPEDCVVFLFSANGIRKNRWKDFDLLKNALIKFKSFTSTKKFIFIALGEKKDNDPVENLPELKFITYKHSPVEVADIYNAADVYLHASKADTFPNVILEALSCGLPVVATAVGGIPEQVKGWAGLNAILPEYNIYSDESATGILVRSGDSDGFAMAMEKLAMPEPRSYLGRNALRDARMRFSLDRQIAEYLNWYYDVLDSRK
ncbi:MAG: glycosyltransferase [Flavobacteriales bacterium]|nr:glycosyltransferase [Flavobacteriales bacterium]